MNANVLRRGLSAVALSALMTIAIGCGSDNNPVVGGGSLTDPAFLEVQPQVDAFFDSVFVAFSAGLSSYNQVPISDGEIKLFYGPGIPGGTNQTTYEYTPEGWHHITIVANNDFVILGVNDSIQFMTGMTVQQSATGADVLDYRHHWAVTQINQTADYANLTGDVGFVFSGLNSTNAVINGANANTVFKRTIDTSGVITDDSFAFSSAVSGVTIPQPAGGTWGTGCPSTGTIAFSLSQVKIVTNGSAVDTTSIAWDGTANFSDGSATVSLSAGALTWNYVIEVCAPAL